MAGRGVDLLNRSCATEVVDQATKACTAYLRISRILPPATIARSVSETWPDPPPPLVFWLWVAGSDLIGRETAEAYLKGFELMLALFEDRRFVGGSWQTRVKKVLPPRGAATFDHYRTLRSTLFEVLLACRLLVRDCQVQLESDNGPSFCDMTVKVHGSPIVRFEAYGPQRGLESWYEDGVLRPWREVALAESAPEARGPAVRDISIDPDAFVKALASILTNSNFTPKAKQLSAGGLPTILAVRAYGLTERLEEVVTIPHVMELARRLGDQAWSCLPSQGQGILVSLLGDVLQDACCDGTHR